MKTILLTLAVFGAITFSVFADEAFPIIGSTYKITYASEPEDSVYRPHEVKIVSKGSNSWLLIEYVIPVRRQIRPVGDGSSVPEQKPVTKRMWLNFALVLSADEKETAEPSDPSKR